MTLSVALHHRFAGFTLDVAFDAPPGVTALFGRSGSGKTTVINAVAGLFTPDRGTISHNGKPLLNTAQRLHVPVHKRRLGYVFQDARLFPHLTVSQNLRYGRWFAPGGSITLDQVVDLLGLHALLPRPPSALSGGEKQRVAIGRALLTNPQLLLMDEPLAALDAPRKAEVLPFLERLRDEIGLPILYVSHSIAEVARLATTIVVLENGLLRHAGPASAALADPALVPALGLRAAGGMITATVAGHDTDHLTRLETCAGPIWLPQIAAEPGRVLRIRIAAQDVILSRTRPTGLSALNILPVTVTAVRMGDGPGAVVQLRLGDDHFLARITQRSAIALHLAPGVAVFAVLKSVSVAPGDISAG